MNKNSFWLNFAYLFIFLLSGPARKDQKERPTIKIAKAALTDHIAGPVDLLLVCVNSRFDLWSRNLFFRRAVFRKPCEKVEDVL